MYPITPHISNVCGDVAFLQTFEADFHVVHHQHPTLWYEDCPK